MTTDTVPKQAATSTPAGWTHRRHGQGRRHARARRWPRCSSCSPPTPWSTPPRSTRRCARPPGSPSTGSTPTAACPPTTPCCCSPPAPPASPPTRAAFTAALTGRLPRPGPQLLADAEGVTKRSPSRSRGAATEDDAVAVARAVARDNLVKTAFFGDDPNWGRVAAAVGTPTPPFDPDRLDVAINGVAAVPRRGGRGRPRRRRPVRHARCIVADRPRAGRRHARDDLHQRPVARLRPREQCVLHMTAATDGLPSPRHREPGHAPGEKAGVLAEALPWLQRFHGAGRRGQVRRQRHDRRRAQAGLRRRTWCSCGSPGIRPVVVHGGGPQITAMLDRLGIPSEFRGGLRVTTPETMDVVRMVLVGQVGRELVGLINAARPVRRRPVRRGRRTCSPPSSAPRSSTASRSTSAWSATSSRSTRTPCSDSSRPAGSRSSPASPRTPTGRCYNVNADTAAAALAVALGAEKLVVLTDVEGLYANWPDRELAASAQHHRRRARADAAEPGVRHGAEDGGLPARGARRACRQAHVIDGRVPHAVLLEVFTDRGRRHDGGPVDEPGRRTTVPGRAGTAALMNNYGTPAARAGARRAAPSLGRRRPPLPRPARRHRGQRARPRPPGGRRGRDRPDRHARAHLEPLRHTSRRCALAERLLDLLGPPDGGCSSATPAPRPTRRRSRSPGGPAGRTWSPPRARFHGRTMGALALTGQPAKRDAVRAAAAGVVARAVRRRRRAGRRRRTATRPRSFLEPIQGEARRRARAGGYLAAARRDHRRARRAAGARRGADRHRPHRRLVRPPAPPGIVPGRRHAGQGPRRRPADRRVHRLRRGRRSCSSPASTAPPSAATRSAAPPRSPCSTRSSATGCWSTSQPVGKELATGIEALGHPLVARRPRAPGCCSASCSPRRSSAAVAAAAARRRLPRQHAVPGRVRLAPPLVLTDGAGRRVRRRAAGVLDAGAAAARGRSR